jgi:hypothetical protein
LRLTVVEWLKAPLVPVTVNTEVARGVVLFVVTVKVELPGVVREDGLKLPAAPVGNPVTPKVMVPLNPPEKATDTL